MPGPPVVLLHGFATSADRTWRDNGWLDLLEDTGREVVAPDLPGHGAAAKPHDPTAYAHIEDDIAAALPDGPLDAIGFSLGSRVLLTIAAADPGRFRRLIVSGVGANLFRDDGHELIVAALRDGAADDGNPVTTYFANLARQPGNDVEALRAVMSAPRLPLDAGCLANVSCPVLVVLGDRDFAGPPDPLVDALPDARLVTLAGVDHFATPKSFAFIDAALDFLGLP